MAMVKDTLLQVEGRLAASEQARTRGEEKNQEFYDHLNEVRQIMGTLSQRMMSLSTAVNQIYFRLSFFLCELSAYRFQFTLKLDCSTDGGNRNPVDERKSQRRNENRNNRCEVGR
jgi:hypothetical protein